MEQIFSKLFLTFTARRTRNFFSTKQKSALVTAFQKNCYCTAREAEELAKETLLEPSQIQTWFNHRRIKWRKENPGTKMVRPSRKINYRSFPEGSYESDEKLYGAFHYP